MFIRLWPGPEASQRPSRLLLPLVVSSLLLFAACQGTTSEPGDNDATVQPTPGSASSVVTLSGFFSVMYGDPPAGSGEPAVIEYWLTDDEGREWLLIFDEDVYRPALGLRQFDREQVEVEGMLTEENAVLVTSIELGESTARQPPSASPDESGEVTTSPQATAKVVAPALTRATAAPDSEPPRDEETAEVESTPTVEPTSVPTANTVKLTGLFSFMYGDPPRDSGLPPVIEHWLTDSEHRDWLLVFDEAVYRPAGGLRQFDRRHVELEGVLKSGGEAILVTSIVLVD